MDQGMKKLVVIIFGIAAGLSAALPAAAQQADVVSIGQSFGVSFGRGPQNASQLTKKLRAWSENGGFPFVAVYRFPAEAGSRYTLVLTYPSDKAGRRIVIAGENPYSDGPVLLPPGKSTSYTLDLTTHPAPAGAGPCTETRRINFTVDPQSNIRGLFLVCLTREVPAPLDVRLNFPAAGDAEVKAYTAMPNCSWLGKIYWGKIVDYTIFMAGPAGGPVKPNAKDVRAEIRNVAGTPLQEGGTFAVPPGFKAIAFRATNRTNFENRGWKIVRLLPGNRTADVYRYGEERDDRTGRTIVSEVPVPLKALVLPADRYQLVISGGAGSWVQVFYELVPAGRGTPSD